MIKIVKTSDKLLPRKQEGWRNSTAAVVNAQAKCCIGQCNSGISDNEIDKISSQVSNQSETIEPYIEPLIKQTPDVSHQIPDVRQYEIEQYIKGFVKQNGSIINNKSINDTKDNKSKVLLG
jgi:hypothetical protein